MKSIALSLLFLVFSQVLYCQHDFLEPMQNYDKKNVPLNNYIRNVLFSIEGSNNNSLFQFTELKTGEAEKSFYIEVEDSNDCVLHIYKKNKKGHSVGLFRIQTKLGNKLLNLIQMAMAQTQFQEGWEPQKDSALFLFNLRDVYGKVHYAEKWNPDENSNIGELTSICHSIFAYDSIYKADLSPLETRIDALTKKMEASLAVYLENKSEVKTIRYFSDDYYEINTSKDTITYYEIDYKLNYIADTLLGFRARKVEKYAKENNATWRNLITGESAIQFDYENRYYNQIYNLKTRRKNYIHWIEKIKQK